MINMSVLGRAPLASAAPALGHAPAHAGTRARRNAARVLPLARESLVARSAGPSTAPISEPAGSARCNSAAVLAGDESAARILLADNGPQHPVSVSQDGVE